MFAISYLTFIHHINKIRCKCEKLLFLWENIWLLCHANLDMPYINHKWSTIINSFMQYSRLLYLNPLNSSWWQRLGAINASSLLLVKIIKTAITKCRATISITCWLLALNCIFQIFITRYNVACIEVVYRFALKPRCFDVCCCWIF